MKDLKIQKQTKYNSVCSIRVMKLVLLVLCLWFTMGTFVSGEEKVDSTAAFENEKPLVKIIESVMENVRPVLDKKYLPVEELLEKECKRYGFSRKEYPKKIVERAKKNPETREFLLNYPFLKDTYSREKLTETKESGEIPLLMQWDSRWGYYEYSGNVMGLSGCGPTCLSMVASYLLDNPELTPIYMADFATENGYAVDGNGTSWDFMSKGAKKLGLKPKGVKIKKKEVKKHLENGRPIICIMGEGIFTDGGHFIVLTGWEDGKIKINDPNSRELSSRLWEFEEIKDQIKNMWVY